MAFCTGRRDTRRSLENPFFCYRAPLCRILLRLRDNLLPSTLCGSVRGEVRLIPWLCARGSALRCAESLNNISGSEVIVLGRLGLFRDSFFESNVLFEHWKFRYCYIIFIGYYYYLICWLSIEMCFENLLKIKYYNKM